MTRYVEQCLVLGLRDKGEDSFTITVLHAELGKQEFLVQGGKKIGAKLAPLLQPLTLADIWVAPSKCEGGRVIEVRVIKDFALLKKRPLSLRFGLRALEILDRATYGLVEAGDLLKVTITIFEAIEKEKAAPDLKKLWISFEMAVLHHLGVSPAQSSLNSHTSLTELARYLEQEIYAACG